MMENGSDFEHHVELESTVMLYVVQAESEKQSGGLNRV